MSPALILPFIPGPLTLLVRLKIRRAFALIIVIFDQTFHGSLRLLHTRIQLSTSIRQAPSVRHFVENDSTIPSRFPLSRGYKTRRSRDRLYRPGGRAGERERVRQQRAGDN